jgi:acetyl esterase
MATIDDDPRIDPRIKAVLGAMPALSEPDVSSRDELLAEMATPEAVAAMAGVDAMFELFDNEELAPSTGLDSSSVEVVSHPDGNTINLFVTRPEGATPLPCVYYIHGGGMMSMSCTLGIYRTWARLLAHQGVCVVMVDFRNCLTPSSVPEVAPFPAGLDDCLSGVRWVAANADRLGVDPGRIVVAGESGGGNLTLATGMRLLRDGDIGLISGLYALCPYLAGAWPQGRFPSSTENEGIVIHLHNNRGAMAYGIEQFEQGNPLAWPSFATEDDVRGLPPTVIHVNECDPLRDEGIEFYRLLQRAGVAARCRVQMGTTHGADLMVSVVPDIAADTAASLALHARSA